MTAFDLACDDNVACTLDTCSEDTGQCVNDNKCGTNHPCQAVAWPESNDADVTKCVCGFDSYCCENAWDSICVSEAQEKCDLSCDCTDAAAPMACSADEDCGFCSDDACAVNYVCTGGVCKEGPGLVCDPSGDTACKKNTCVNGGQCEVVVTHTACADGKACTADLCDEETGTCSNPAIDGCAGEPPFECKGPQEPSLQGCDYVNSQEGCCDPWGRVMWCDEVFDDVSGSFKDVTFCIDCAGKNPFCGWSGFYYNCGTEGDEGPDEFPMTCNMP